MRRILRLIAFFIVNLFFFVLAIIVGILFLPFGQKIHRSVTTSLVPVWAGLFLAVLNVKVKLINREYLKKGQNYFIIANHLSYLDVIIVGSQIPVLFVAKKEVRSWPLIGTLAWLGGMVFVDRSITGSKERPYVKQIVKFLQDGFNISIFPEGTSSNGESVLPFKKTIFSCPVRSNTPILPLAIQYISVNKKPFSPENRDLVCWYAKMNFADHFWNFLNLKEFRVEIIVQTPQIEPPEDDWLAQNTRLAEKYHDIIERAYLKQQ